MGRPRKSDDEKRSKTLELSVTPAEKEQFVGLADEMHMSLSDLLHTIIVKGYKGLPQPRTLPLDVAQVLTQLQGMDNQLLRLRQLLSTNDVLSDTDRQTITQTLTDVRKLSSATRAFCLQAFEQQDLFHLLKQTAEQLPVLANRLDDRTDTVNVQTQLFLLHQELMRFQLRNSPQIA